MTDNQSEPHIATPAKPGILLVPKNSKAKAEEVLNELKSGKSCKVDCLEVLDDILRLMSEEDESNFTIWSGHHHIDWAMIKRLRFDRGLDVRPR